MPTPHDHIDHINQHEMRKGASVRHYSREDSLSAAERAALDEVASQAKGRAVLDIGVGGGRTVKALRAVSDNYLGVDYSSAMVQACRRRYPGVRFEHADARAMEMLADGSIHLAMFSCNGIGMVSHADRLKIMHEVFRVLEPGGVFLFSTHNKNCPDHDAGFQFPEMNFSVNPVRTALRMARFVWRTPRRWVRRQRLLRHEVRTPDYSIINDVCHDYGVMLYYISLAKQREQLCAIGFEADAAAFDLHGQRITADSTHSSMMFIARKPGGVTR